MYFIVTKCCAKGSIQSSQKWKLKIIGPIWARKFIFTVLQKNKKNFTFFNDDVQTKMACLSTIMIGFRTCKVSMYDFRYYANMPMYFIVTKCCAKGSIQSSQKWKLKIIGPIWARKFIFTVLQKNKKNFTFFNDDVQTKMACLSTIMIGLRTCKVSLYDFRYYANMPMYFIVTKCCAKGSIQSSQKWKLKIIGPIWAWKFIFTVLQKNKKNFTFFNDDVETKMACLSTT